MARYKLSNALRGTDAQEFENDEIAWNTLRKTFSHGHFIWMWKEVAVEVPINNEESYVKEYNSKYGPAPIGYGGKDAKLMKVGEKNMENMWVPVLCGITSDHYNVKNL
jgi:hypothetical protein